MVNKRVYFLMKKRLTTEVDQEPPLFPWETEVKDYGNEPSGDLIAEQVAEKATEKISSPETTDETNQVLSGNTKEAPPPAF
jgi:hypothetical protein